MPDAAGKRRTLVATVLLFVVLVAIYAANFRMLSAGDSLPTRVLPFSILREGDIDLDEFSWEKTQQGGPPYYLRLIDNRLYSGSPMVLPFVITPLYVLPAWLLSAHGIPYDDVRARVIIVMMERLSAAVVAAASTAILFVVLQRLTTRRAALTLAVVYALGTSTWSIASQALWTHGLAELCVILLTLIFLRDGGASNLWAVLAGIIAVLAVANRPPMVVFALLALVFVWRRWRRQLLAFVALPAIGAALVLAFNFLLYGRLTGGYGVGLGSFRGNLLTGVAGLLMSPNRGLFVYTPLMLFASLGAVRVWQERAHPWLRYLTVGVLLHTLVYGKFSEWWGGYAYGPRYMTDVLPALTILLVYGLVPLWRFAGIRPLIVLLTLYGVGVQAIGVYAADDRWNREPVPLELQPGRVWDWSDLQITRAWHNGWRAGELAPVMFDAFRDRVPARVAPMTESDLASAITMRSLPAAVRRGTNATGVVEITNRGNAAWPAFSGDGVISSRYLVFLLARWFQQGQLLEGAGDVLPLPKNLPPGETVSMPFSVAVPSVAGDLELELRVTQAVDRAHGLISQDALRVLVKVE